MGGARPPHRRLVVHERRRPGVVAWQPIRRSSWRATECGLAAVGHYIGAGAAGRSWPNSPSRGVLLARSAMRVPAPTAMCVAARDTGCAQGTLEVLPPAPAGGATGKGYRK